MIGRRAFAGGLAAAALAGCGQGGAVVSRGPVGFADDKPAEWGRMGPGRHPVHGIDVNKHQPVIDWRMARANGVGFAWIKATEGGDHDNPLFLQQWHGARAAGVPMGAFHFYYFCTPPQEQARWFMRTVPRERGSLPPVLDLEWNPFSPTCTLRPPAAEVRKAAGTWLDMVHRHYGQRPMIYTDIAFWEQNELWKIGREEFWLRSVSAHPSQRYGNTRWSFWQYSGTGRVPGIAHQVDLNVFAGDEAGWQAWLAARRV